MSRRIDEANPNPAEGFRALDRSLQRVGVRIRLLQSPSLIVPFLAGATSIGSLLGYFYGLFSMRVGVLAVLIPGFAVATAFVALARRRGRPDLADRVLAGVFAGGFATLAYDLCRIPLVHAGLPIFKAISYFGTLIVGSESVTSFAEVVGWAYHYSNGVGFAVMYAALAVKDRLWTAVAWGVFLESAMLATPYAEVFGYTRGQQFLAITLGAHVVYGLGLWAGLRIWKSHGRSTQLLWAGFAVPMLGVALIGADFHRLHAPKLAPPPPLAIGSHLYTTWNVLEVDRIATLWVVKRHLDPAAEFALLPPFTKTPYGIPLDVPEAEIRRTGGMSAAAVALAKAGRLDDPMLARLAAIATHYEVTPWAPPSAEARALGEALLARSEVCGDHPSPACLGPLFDALDEWYRNEGTIE